MKKKSLALSALILMGILSCKTERQFSEGKKLSEFKKTQFIPTLEHQVTKDKNAIYAATLLFAWDEIRTQLESPIKVSDSYADLALINQSTSFKNVLKKDEYTASGEIERDSITAIATFDKALPFEFSLQSYSDKLIFGGEKVSSFGVNGFDEGGKRGLVRIVYYKNDSNFIIKLLPKDTEHDIILFKTDKSFATIAAMAKEIEKLTKLGNAEKENRKLSWKYHYNDDDEVVIPKLNFNIQTNYATLEGNKFSTQKKQFHIGTVWQRTAFLLDESGAAVESEVMIAAAVEAIEGESEKPKPKKMVFDKPFLVLLKRTEAVNPYLGLWIANAELMVKE